MKRIELFTDGACRGNPGPGGWGALLRWRGRERQLSGACARTTNNRMELTAAIEGLSALTEPCEVVLVTDSRYLRSGITEWLPNWKRRNWRNASRKPVKNVDLWQALERAASRHRVSWHWVKGHSGHRENELADRLAKQAIARLPALGAAEER